MVLLEFGPPFQWKPSVAVFGDFKRVMWGWCAVTFFSGGGINELLEGIAHAAVELHKQDTHEAALKAQRRG